MLETLLESRSRKARSATGTVVSVTAHTVLIAAAVYATAQARVSPPTVLTMARPLYFPPPVRAVHPGGPARTVTIPRIMKRLVFVPPVHVEFAPPIDVSGVLSRPADCPTSTLLGSGADAHGLAAPDSMVGTFRADEVERQAALAAGSKPPVYPEALRSAGIEGRVTAIFVVDESGRAEASSVRFLRSDNGLFEAAVRAALRRMRFTAAEIGGRKVRQLVQMPFVFTLQK